MYAHHVRECSYCQSRRLQVDLDAQWRRAWFVFGTMAGLTALLGLMFSMVL